MSQLSPDKDGSCSAQALMKLFAVSSQLQHDYKISYSPLSIFSLALL